MRGRETERQRDWEGERLRRRENRGDWGRQREVGTERVRGPGETEREVEKLRQREGGRRN